MDIFYIPQPVDVDSTGTPLAGAKLNFYAAGTSTPEPIYTTSALSVQHSNPVVADSAGRFPAIYLGTANDYKVTFTTSTDVVVYTQDNIKNSQIPASKIETAAITAIKIADDNVTLAKMAHGTQGGLLYYAASGVPSELAAGTAEQVLTTKGASNNPVWQSLPYPTDHRNGLTLSINSSDSDHDIDIAAGHARDDSDTVNIVCAEMTKRADATFSEGTGNGMLSTGTLAVDTSYYIFAIAKADGTQDYLLHTTANPSGNLPTDYLYYAALNGGVPLLTDSSANLINSMNGKFVSEVFTAPAAASETTLTHGLGTRPSDIKLWAVATATTDGYTVGDIILIGTMSGSAASSGHGFDVSDASTIVLQWATNNPLIRHKTTGTNVDIEPAIYDVYVTAEI